ncbi:hypothetical protein SDJN02_01453, partial [Cucurbita argyrosperma subsp. argyrosperma]
MVPVVALSFKRGFRGRPRRATILYPELNVGNNLNILRSPPLPVLVPPPEEEGLERLEKGKNRYKSAANPITLSCYIVAAAALLLSVAHQSSFGNE